MDYDRLPFAELLEYLARKTNLDTDSWREGMGVVQDAAFTVAAAKGALLQEIRDALDRAIASGQSVSDFVQVFDAIAARWSLAWPLRGATGWRAQLIYDQNLRQAYAAGRYRQMTQPDVLARRPYWQWRHGGSLVPRPEHKAMDRRVFRADSFPVPPWGFGCQCQIFALSQRDIDRLGLTIEIYGDDSPKPDQGFDNRAGSSQQRFEQSIDKLDPGLRSQARREVGLD